MFNLTTLDVDSIKQQMEQRLEQIGRLNPTKLDLTKFDVRSIELPKMELPFELPNIEFPKFELPFELPNIEFPKMELPFEMPSAERVAGFARDAAYVGVGATVVAVRAADEQRKAVTAQVTAQVRKLVDTVA